MYLLVIEQSSLHATTLISEYFSCAFVASVAVSIDCDLKGEKKCCRLIMELHVTRISISSLFIAFGVLLLRIGQTYVNVFEWNFIVENSEASSNTCKDFL